jgi:hypothetical protein
MEQEGAEPVALMEPEGAEPVAPMEQEGSSVVVAGGSAEARADTILRCKYLTKSFPHVSNWITPKAIKNMSKAVSSMLCVCRFNKMLLT